MSNPYGNDEVLSSHQTYQPKHADMDKPEGFGKLKFRRQNRQALKRNLRLAVTRAENGR